MKILQLVTERQYRGAQVFAAELTALLAANGHEVIFAGLYPAKENVLSAQGAENVDFDGVKKAFDFSLLSKVVKFIKTRKPDIIQANGSDTLKYLAAAKLFCPGIKIVYRNISMVSAWSGRASVKRKLNSLLFKQVSRVTSVGQQSLNDLVKTYHFPVEKTRLIRRGIPQFHFNREAARNKVAAEFGFNIQDPIVSHIGQFSPEKNHAFMIQAFRKVLTAVPGAKLLFIGDGKKFSEIKAMVQQMGLQGSIFFTGHRNNVQELLAGTDVFILGSTIEGVPGVVLEAGIQQLPTVAVNVGGVGEVIRNGDTGILLDKHDESDFSEAIITLLNNEALRTTFGNNAQKMVAENYSLANCVKQFEILYNEILIEKRKS